MGLLWRLTLTQSPVGGQLERLSFLFSHQFPRFISTERLFSLSSVALCLDIVSMPRKLLENRGAPLESLLFL